MAYLVEIAEPAERDIEDAYVWYYQKSPDKANEWFRGLCRAIDSLSVFPRRCPIAAESRDLEREIRQLLHGRRRQMLRILYEIRGDRVVVLRLRHVARASLEPEDLEPGL